MFRKTAFQFVCGTNVIPLSGFALQDVNDAHEEMVGPCGLEPQTSTVSRWRSNQLSYGPMLSFTLAQRRGTADLADSGRLALTN